VICARCDQPIQPGERYVQVDNPGASAAGATLHIHADRCVPVPHQTYPANSFGR
jgi:hypothetical protein